VEAALRKGSWEAKLKSDRTARFVALDSWRGVAACMVALYHLRALSHISELRLVGNAYLFVDFFFALSGFVIAATYAERLARGFGLWRFMVLRFGRVYPLHFALLAAFLAVGGATVASADESKALFAHALLLHGLGAIKVPVWGNVPSWSISTELFVYLIFAMAVCTLRRRADWLLVPAVVVLPWVIYVGAGAMRDSDGYQLLRALYGFAAGVLAWKAFAALPRTTRSTTLAELAAVGALVAFVTIAGDNAWSIAAPAVFAVLIVVFAYEAGAVSRILVHKAFVLIGTLSYSIYMIHYFVARRAVEVVVFADSAGIPLRAYLGVEKWAGDLALAVYLLTIVGLSMLTYGMVEVPCRAWFRALASRRASGLEAERAATAHNP
jgi:peptidoglycan/LPS O-acetylase OafA/YrhL